MLVIGLAGLARAGKTTAAETLARLLIDKGYNIKMMHFAGPLKDAAERIGAGKTVRPELYRKFCQLVGTDMMRDKTFCPPHTGPTYWIDLMDAELSEFAEVEAVRYKNTETKEWRETAVLVDDVRYPNEVDLITKWGGNTVIVDAGHRLGLAGLREVEREKLPVPYNHSSEKLALDYMFGEIPDEAFDFSVSNNLQLEVFTGVLEQSIDFLLTGAIIGD